MSARHSASCLVVTQGGTISGSIAPLPVAAEYGRSAANGKVIPGQTIGADDGQLESNSTDGNLMFLNQVVEVLSQSMGKNLQESPPIRL
jgi:hypothetical protein